MSEALELLDERDQVEVLRAKIALGAEEAARGDLIPYTSGLLEALRREARQMARADKRWDSESI